MKLWTEKCSLELISTFSRSGMDGESSDSKRRYQRRGEHYLFTSRVATEGHLRHLSWNEISREILLRNRLTEVVAFGVRN